MFNLSKIFRKKVETAIKNQEDLVKKDGRYEKDWKEAHEMNEKYDDALKEAADALEYYLSLDGQFSEEGEKAEAVFKDKLNDFSKIHRQANGISIMEVFKKKLAGDGWTEWSRRIESIIEDKLESQYIENKKNDSE